jgi:hypothetical protein
MDYRPYVERLFRQAADRSHPTRRNPVTGARWVRGVDPIKPQKDIACRALVAREWFAWDNPGLKPLPITYAEWEELKSHGGVDYIESVYARSLAAQRYEISRHESFGRYARGVMASPYAPDFIKEDQQLLKQYPPRPLRGLGPGLYFDPAK